MTSQSHSVHCVTQLLTISFLNIAEHLSYKLVIYMFHCDDVTMDYCWNDVRNSLHLKWLLIFYGRKSGVGTCDKKNRPWFVFEYDCYQTLCDYF